MVRVTMVEVYNQELFPRKGRECQGAVKRWKHQYYVYVDENAFK